MTTWLGFSKASCSAGQSAQCWVCSLSHGLTTLVFLHTHALTRPHPPRDCTEWGSRPEGGVAGPLSLSETPHHVQCHRPCCSSKSNALFAHVFPTVSKARPRQQLWRITLLTHSSQVRVTCSRAFTSLLKSPRNSPGSSTV